MSEETGLCIDHILGSKRGAVRDFVKKVGSSGVELIALDNCDYNEVLRMSCDPALGSGWSDATLQTAVAHALNCNSVRRCLSTVGEKGMIAKVISGDELATRDVMLMGETLMEALGDEAVFYFGVTIDSEMKNVKEVALLAAVRDKSNAA